MMTVFVKDSSLFPSLSLFGVAIGGLQLSQSSKPYLQEKDLPSLAWLYEDALILPVDMWMLSADSRGSVCSSLHFLSFSTHGDIAQPINPYAENFNSLLNFSVLVVRYRTNPMHGLGADSQG